MTESCGLWNPRPHRVGRRMVLLVKARGLPAAEVCHKPYNQDVSESRAVDHLNEEAVRTVSNAFGRSTAMEIVLVGGFHWLKPETTVAEIESRAEEVECLDRFEAVLGWARS